LNMLRFLTRPQIHDAAWNRCVSEAPNALVYGHTWYLDAVTDLPDWKWEGLVAANNHPKPLSGADDGYSAVLPIPLRRRWGRWVVYQPLFCQFLALFAKQPADPTPFIQAVYARYRHVSKWHLLLDEPLAGLPHQVHQQRLYTHVLAIPDAKSSGADVTPGKPTQYTADRRMNLRRAVRDTAQVPDWQVIESTDIEPLLTLFQENHADGIGVGAWAYTLFRGLFAAVQQRGLVTLRYARAGGQLVAGALFVEQHGRIIYLFNAANAEGRRLNARSILIDELIQKKRSEAAAEPLTRPLQLDFESPEKPGVVSFYASFGATPQPYVVFSWSRLTWLERLAKHLLNTIKAYR
jgi:hypothetical protein